MSSSLWWEAWSLPPPPSPEAGCGVRRYNDQFNGRDVASSVKVSADNFRLYVTGTSWQGSAAKNDYLTIAYARAGYRLWVRR